MNKKIWVCMLIVFLFLLTSCSNDKKSDNRIATTKNKYDGKSGTVSCVIEKSTQNLDFKGTYNFNYVDGVVTNAYSREVAKLNGSKLADSYEKQIKKEYLIYNDIDYYVYDISRFEDTITNTSSINYQNIDLSVLSEKTNKTIDADSLKVNNVIASYKIIGAQCTIE